MRSYENDSIRAAARVIAMTVLADGVPDRSELACLKEPEGLRSLGIAPELFDEVMQAYCEDIEQSIGWFDSLNGRLQPEFIDVLLNEVSEPALRHSLFALMLQLVTADGSVSDGERWMLSRAHQQWGCGAHWPVRICAPAEDRVDIIA